MIDLENAMRSSFIAANGREVKILASLTHKSIKYWIGVEFNEKCNDNFPFQAFKYNKNGKCLDFLDGTHNLIEPFEITKKDVWRIAKTAAGERVMIVFFDGTTFHGCIEGHEELECWDANGVILYGLNAKHSLVAWE